MKRTISMLAAVLLAIGLTACGKTESPTSNDATRNTQAESSREAETSSDTEEIIRQSATSDSGSGTQDTASEEMSSEGMTSESENLSSEEMSREEMSPEELSAEETDNTQKNGGTLVVYFSATGTTRGVAEKIAAITGADIYEIRAAQEYTSGDLNWNDRESRSTKEQNDSSARPEIGSDPVSLDGYDTIYIGYPIWWGEEPRILDTFVGQYDFDGITMIPFCTSSSSGMGRSGQNLADNAGSGTWLDGQRFGGGASESEIESWINSLQ